MTTDRLLYMYNSHFNGHKFNFENFRQLYFIAMHDMLIVYSQT